MRHYHKPIYVSHGGSNDTNGLKQALSLARNNDAPLKILVAAPELPDTFSDYRKQYEESLIAQAEEAVHTTKDAMALAADEVEVSIETINGRSPSLQIVQYVLRHGHDLLIKEAQPHDQSAKGFTAVDMNLLRKCPCPVWLCRPIDRHREQIQVAVAIDPVSLEPAAENLSKRMLELSRALADSCSGKLNVISCWDYEFESYLRHTPWIKTSDEEVTKAVRHAEQDHRAKLDALIAAAGISGDITVHHLRGAAQELIPTTVRARSIDILVMGTVARTGIPGLFIGNTAENIVQRLDCSVMALKPQGFVSPVRAY